ncbi:uncharacterized protein LOC125473010 [Pyrus x bretschneideri]|uniref:uncharacterized protein LOC125473010 n=1 Tax=Pyrus x bretschneideri TaxID=225117 RepID=UPI00202FED68|nr:uncharacterized protein LOC125473010 [Pyrus x bretschneideri]
MVTIFKSYGLWNLVEKGISVSDSKKKEAKTDEDTDVDADDNEKMAAIFMKDPKALGIIQNAVSDQIFPRIANADSAKMAWDLLYGEYHGGDQVRSVKLQNLRREFEYTRMCDDESLTGYLTRLNDLINQMKTFGETLSNERLVQKVLISLTKIYDPICLVIENTKCLESVELQEVLAILKSQEQRFDLHSSDVTERAFSSLTVSSKGQNRSYPQSNIRGNPSAITVIDLVIGLESVLFGKSVQKANCASQMEVTGNLFYANCAVAETKVNGDWYIDSGCSNHMTGNVDLLVDMNTNVARKVQMPTGVLVNVAGMGSLEIETNRGRKYIREVMYLPGLKENLLSIGQMDEHGYYLMFGGHMCCQYGKQHRERFPSGQAQRAGAPLELVHVDLCGPMRIESTGGNKYFMLLVDDATRMIWVYFLRFKSEALTCFQKFKAMTELQSGMKVKCVRSDRGGEFLSNEFKQYCDTEGIQRQLSISYTPQQNGVVERKNRTVIEMAKSMLHDKGMPYYMWAEAVHTAVYLLNRCPTKSLDSIIPFDAYSKRKPGIAHLKVFGSVCYVHTPSELRHRLEPKSIKGVFVGYAKCEKGYRVFDPISTRLILSRDVVFDENSSWDWERSTERYMSLPTYEFDTVDTPRSENTEHDTQGSSGLSPGILEEAA